MLCSQNAFQCYQNYRIADGQNTDFILKTSLKNWGFPSGSDGRESACSAGDPDSIPGQEDPLDKEVATHSSTPDQRIPGTEEPSGLPSTGSQRVKHDCLTNTFTSIL